MMNEKGAYNIPILTYFGTCHNPLYYLLVVTMEYLPTIHLFFP